MRKAITWMLFLFVSSLLHAQNPDSGAIEKKILTPERIAYRSMILPGYGQWTNGQYLKAPIISAAVGAGIYSGIHYSSLFAKYEKSTLIRIGDNTTLTDPIAGMENLEVFKKTFVYGNYKRYSVFFTLYAYGINVLDAYTFASIQGESPHHSPTKAAYYSALLPGLGQIYNHKYWKAPIALGLVATAAGFSSYYNNIYRDFALAYASRSDNDPLSEYETEFTSAYPTSQLKNEADQWRNYRDMAYLATAAVYLLNLVDAIVDAHLYDFDLSDDLSKRQAPPRISVSTFSLPRAGNTGYHGLALSWRF